MATGVIQNKMARPNGQELNLDNVKNHIKMPPALQEAYQRVVLAGMKVMFSEQTHQLMLKEMDGPGDIAEKLGRGVAGLMLLLFKQSNKTIPPQVMIPAGMDLLMQAADFVRQTNMAQVQNKDISDATEIMVGTLIQAFGGKPQNVFQMAGNFDRSKIKAAQAPQQMGA